MDGKVAPGPYPAADSFARAFEGTGKKTPLRAALEARYARLQALLSEWKGQLPAEDWRIRLVHKALFSTWADLHALQEAKEGSR